MNEWTCDSCGCAIENVDDGWVEWAKPAPGKACGEPLAGGDNREYRGLRLVHHRNANRRCTYDEGRLYAEGLLVSDMHLDYFLGPDGLMVLLSMIAEKKVSVEEGLEMIKRLHIPGYEQARPFFDVAINDGVFEPNTYERFYWQYQIQAVLKYARQKR